MTTIVTRAGKGSALTWTEGDANFTNLNNAKLENVVEDLSPQLGGNLDVNGNSIVSASNGNIAITPNGTGSIVLDGLNWPQADGTADYVLKTNGSGQLSWTAQSGGTSLPSQTGNTDKVLTTDGTNLSWTDTLTGKTLTKYKETVYAGGSQSTGYTPNWNNGPVHTVTLTGNVTFAAPTNMVAGASMTLILTQDGTGGRTGTWNASYKWLGGTPVLSTAAAAVDVVNIFYDGTNYITGISKQDTSSSVTGLTITAAGELRLADTDSSNYVGFKSPATVSANKVWTLPDADGTANQVLKTNGSGTLGWATPFDPASPGAIGGTTASSGAFTSLSATTSLTFKEPREAIYDNGNSGTATITPNAANGSVQKYTLTGNITLNAFGTPVAGQSMTLLLIQDATGSRTLTSSMKWAGGTKTLSTAANSIDIATIYYDGTNYYASLGKGFA